jgi:hypothetical protein
MRYQARHPASRETRGHRDGGENRGERSRAVLAVTVEVTRGLANRADSPIRWIETTRSSCIQDQ